MYGLYLYSKQIRSHTVKVKGFRSPSGCAGEIFHVAVCNLYASSKGSMLNWCRSRKMKLRGVIDILPHEDPGMQTPSHIVFKSSLNSESVKRNMYILLS
jgi:hypothetical protein